MRAGVKRYIIKSNEAGKDEPETTILPQTFESDGPDRISQTASIVYPLSDEVRSSPLFTEFESRKKFLQYACKRSRQIFDKNMGFHEKVRLQKEINEGTAKPDEKECIPVLSREERFAKYKYHI